MPIQLNSPMGRQPFMNSPMPRPGMMNPRISLTPKPPQRYVPQKPRTGQPTLATPFRDGPPGPPPPPPPLRSILVPPGRKTQPAPPPKPPKPEPPPLWHPPLIIPGDGGAPHWDKSPPKWYQDMQGAAPIQQRWNPDYFSTYAPPSVAQYGPLRGLYT